MKRIFFLTACVVLLSGCVSYTEDIDPSYENTDYLRDPQLTCDDLAAIAQNLSSQLHQLRRAQDRSAKSDRLNILFLGAFAWRNLLTEDNDRGNRQSQRTSRSTPRRTGAETVRYRAGTR